MPAATPEVVAEAFNNNPALVTAQIDPNLDFEADPRDHATPFAMLKLLLAIDGGTAMSAESSEFLLGVMSRTRTGAGRLKGLLPKGTPVAHKTGTAGGVPTTLAISRSLTVGGLLSPCSRTATRHPCRTGIGQLPRSPARFSTTSTCLRLRSNRWVNRSGAHPLPVRPQTLHLTISRPRVEDSERISTGLVARFHPG